VSINSRAASPQRASSCGVSILYVGFALSAFASLAVVVLRGNEPHLV
jgi:hypothetical protein